MFKRTSQFPNEATRRSQAVSSPVWFANLRQSCWDEDEDLVESFDPLERERARSFVSPIDRRDYIRSHCALRLLLAEWLDVKASTLRIEWESGGRPRFRHPTSGEPGFLSMARRQGFLLVAADERAPLGVDLERIQMLPELEAMIPMVLSAREHRMLQLVDEDSKPEWFLRAWVRKEAAAKAAGVGLQADLRRIEVGPSLVDESALTQLGLGSLHVVDLDLPRPLLGSFCGSVSESNRPELSSARVGPGVVRFKHGRTVHGLPQAASS